MRTPNLKFILETILEDQPKPMSKEEKRAFMQEVANFSALGELLKKHTPEFPKQVELKLPKLKKIEQ